jgi:hypothetical protein
MRRTAWRGGCVGPPNIAWRAGQSRTCIPRHFQFHSCQLTNGLTLIGRTVARCQKSSGVRHRARCCSIPHRCRRRQRPAISPSASSFLVGVGMTVCKLYAYMLQCTYPDVFEPAKPVVAFFSCMHGQRSSITGPPLVLNVALTVPIDCRVSALLAILLAKH